ncbi:TATA-box binding protein associated factor 1 isoform X2 [Arctopsyche grandis]|uniref:TATA-box binding protein associated factor 1 isoform X2 n=1 Tax=Arctopsyche grandis TaxID=121162 RepID=UPI00406D9B25
MVGSDCEDEGTGVDLTGFLFGNIDDSGHLEDDDLLDGESKRMLGSLGRLGLGSLLAEVIESGDDDSQDANDYQQKSPSAVDYFDFAELAEDIENQNGNSNEDGYEGDMEGDGNLMPPPLPPGSPKDSRRLETPLAAMLPSKYANVDVTELFPDFRVGKVLRFSRLFGPGKASSLPQIWRGVRRRRKRRRTDSASSDITTANIVPKTETEQCSDDEEKLLRPWEEGSGSNNNNFSNNNNNERQTTAHWRFGPAQVWYDMLQVPESGEGFNYGFKLKQETELETIPEEVFPDEAFLMVSQLQWEDDVVWDGNEIKQKVMARLNSKTNAAGWLPSSGNRTAQAFSHPGRAPLPHLPKQPPPTGEDDTWYSIFPVENEELVYGQWEEEVIWDATAMKTLPEPKVLTLDPNDENIILGIPDDIDPSKIQQERGPQPKVKIPHPHVKKSKLLLGKAGVINVLQEDAPPPPPKSPDRDPFNISNDIFYATRSSTLRLRAGGVQLIQHSTPAVELRAPVVQTHMGPARLRAFHRPALRKYSHGVLATPGPHHVAPLLKHIKKKAKQRESERMASGGGDVFFMRSVDDLSGRDGELVLVEFCEEHPPLINQVGMCSKIKNYYKRITGKDNGPKPFKYGEVAYAHTSPFLGILSPGQSQQVVENNMYRTPIYPHNVPNTDFLVIRSRQQYFVREIDALFMAGQECPLYEVPGPNSKRANNFVRDFLQVFIYRLFWKSRDKPRRIRMDDIKRAFPAHSESSIRKRLKLCADFKRTGLDSNWWVIKPEFRLPSEEEIRAMVSPEQCCAYFSMAAAEQRLKDAGYGEKFLFTQHEDDDEEMQLKMDDEIKVAPWNTTRAYIQAMRGKCLLQLTGPADPTGCGEGFSYVRVPNKPIQSKEEQDQQQKRTVTGTDADLRRLSLNDAKALLRKFGVPEDEIKKLSRWEVIDVVRTLSTEKAKAGEEGMTKFSRGNRFSIAEHQERYKEECQRIFELQNRVLSSTEVLSTDEAESSVSEESDLEEMGKNLENMLANKKTTEQLSLEREEAELAELRLLILGKSENKPRARDANQQPNTSHAGRVLRIVRTFRNTAGKEYTRVEIVRKAPVIEAYTKIRKTKDDSFIRQFATLDDAQKEEMKREKRRIQEQLRRIKRNQERERLAGNTTTPALLQQNMGSGNSGSGASTSIDPASGLLPLHRIKQEDVSPKRRRAKLKPDLKLKCGACGQVGHMRTNKACPLYSGSSGNMNVALTEEQEEEIQREFNQDDEELVNLEDTKVTLSGKLIKHAEEMKRRSMMLRLPKDAAGARSNTSLLGINRKARISESDYYPVRRPAERRRTDPLVTLSSMLEDVLNDMRHLPDVQPFLFPVNAKLVEDYYRIVTRPMDLQTIRDNLRQKRYQSREEFLADVNQIVDNSTLYNGNKSSLTVAAQRMWARCVELLTEKEDQLMRLEKAINPLLDDNDQVALSFILENLLNTKLKGMSEAWPFLKPVNKKQVKDYYNVIKHPMDLDTIGKKIQAHKYHNRAEFLQDIELICRNCEAYNGAQSTFTQQAQTLLSVTRDALNQLGDQVTQLEEIIAKVQRKMREDADLLDDDGDVDREEDAFGGEPREDGPSTQDKPKKHKPFDGGEGRAPKRSKNKAGKSHDNSLEDDLQFSGSESSDFEEVDPAQQQDAAEAMVQLSNLPYCHNPDDGSLDVDPNYDPSDFLVSGTSVKREIIPIESYDDVEGVPYEENATSMDHQAIGLGYPVANTDYNVSDGVNYDFDMSGQYDNTDVKINYQEFNPSAMSYQEQDPSEIIQQPMDIPLKQEPEEQPQYQNEPAIQDDLQVTDSEEEPEDGLWF